MSHIVLARHGQASFLERDYDKLCANGEAQAGLLGEYWSRRRVVFGGVYSGPPVRQLETARIVAEAYRGAGLSFPEVVVMSEFDEYISNARSRAGSSATTIRKRAPLPASAGRSSSRCSRRSS